MRSKLNRVNAWARKIRNEMKMAEIWKLFYRKLQGHINYYAVSHNLGRVKAFVHKATRILFKWLNCRSQRNSFNWEQFQLFIKANPLPIIKIKHKSF